MNLCIEHTLLNILLKSSEGLEGGLRMRDQYAKTVMICFGFVLLGWVIFEWSISVFGLLCLGCLLAPLVYQALAGKLAHPQSEEERHKRLRLELLRGVAYKPAKPELISDPDSNALFHQERVQRQKK